MRCVWRELPGEGQRLPPYSEKSRGRVGSEVRGQGVATGLF